MREAGGFHWSGLTKTKREDGGKDPEVGRRKSHGWEKEPKRRSKGEGETTKEGRRAEDEEQPGGVRAEVGVRWPHVTKKVLTPFRSPGGWVICSHIRTKMLFRNIFYRTFLYLARLTIQRIPLLLRDWALASPSFGKGEKGGAGVLAKRFGVTGPEASHFPVSFFTVRRAGKSEQLAGVY